jgi:hypothetical protein
MIDKKEFLEAVDYRITEGSTYGWKCFGPTAYSLDSWNGDQDGFCASIVFDTKTQVVYQASVYDYRNNRAYRLTNPDFAELHRKEAESHDVDMKQAWDDVEYTDLDVVSDFVEKLVAIANEEDYDTRVQIEVNFADDELLRYMKLAHEHDMTFNAFVEEALRTAIEKHGPS